jgi:glycosyltransferase involved in cell wall biosynthesis
MRPLISICLPNLNTRPFLEPRMQSILAQTLTDWELIIGDSHSEDGAWEYFQTFHGDPRIRLEQIPRAGIYAGWNECLRRATGKYIWIATSDDTAEPPFLERLVGTLERYPDVALAACRFRRIDEAGSAIPKARPVDDFDRLFGAILTIPHRRHRAAQGILEYCMADDWGNMAAVVFRRELLDRAGYFLTQFGSIADYAWRMKAILFSDLIYLPESLAAWRIHGTQATYNQPAGAPERSLRMIRQILAESEPFLPIEWTDHADYRNRLLHGFTARVLRCRYGLDRLTLRRAPRRFLRDCLRAAVRNPLYLFERCATGFSWHSRWFESEYDYARRLIAEWQAPWPPVAISL